MEGPRSRVQAQREGSGSLADGLFNRLTMKEKKQQLLQRHSDGEESHSVALALRAIKALSLRQASVLLIMQQDYNAFAQHPNLPAAVLHQPLAF